MPGDLIAAAVAAFVLIAVVVIRTVTDGRVQITLNDAIIAAIAAGLALFMTGSITKFTASPTTGVVLERAGSAIVAASDKPANTPGQVTPMPVAPFEEVLKGGPSELPNLVQRRVQGIDFILGMGGYDLNVVKLYLETLTQQQYFKGVVIRERNGSLIGMIDGRRLLEASRDRASGVTLADFVAMINRGNSDDLVKIAKIPGFIAASDAATPKDVKREVLKKMDNAHIDWWPAVDNEGKVIGTVDRERLISSLILDVTEQLRVGVPAPAR